MKSHLEAKLVEICASLFNQQLPIELSRPEQQFGDYSTNVALKLAKDLNRNPREIADELSARISQKLGGELKSVNVAGPGFINLTLTDQSLIDSLSTEPEKTMENKQVVAEYSDPNPFKVLHAGHLYTSVVGDSIANLLETAGATVHRVNFGGDVGLHVAKTMWAIVKDLGGELPDKLNEIPEDNRSEWMAKAYIEGTNTYEENERARLEIIEYNKRIYKLHTDNDHDSDFARIYWTCRQWSYDYFNNFYNRIGTHFEKYYPESETAPIGLATVRAHIGDVYEESDGAVIFDGEKYGLHTRVFINSSGLPTYEAKDVGLIIKKWQDYEFDQSVIITGNDIIEYMKVVLKSIERFKPELPPRSRHLTHGIVKLSGGTKMSSRKGNILRAVDVLDAAAKANLELTNKEDNSTVLGAVKYSFLKSRIGGDIIYDPEESVTIEGNSGPYLQYAHARARSILKKAETDYGVYEIKDELDKKERALVAKISEYPEAIDKAISELMPHHVCTYLYELAQTFNRFYEGSRVIGDERQDLRLKLVGLYAARLKNGLGLLGIDAPDSM
jgi:arginyl-tRNA synthetase